MSASQSAGILLGSVPALASIKAFEGSLPHALDSGVWLNRAALRRSAPTGR